MYIQLCKNENTKCFARFAMLITVETHHRSKKKKKKAIGNSAVYTDKCISDQHKLL